jgi:hypothetical protein
MVDEPGSLFGTRERFRESAGSGDKMRRFGEIGGVRFGRDSGAAPWGLGREFGRDASWVRPRCVCFDESAVPRRWRVKRTSSVEVLHRWGLVFA